ncbi:MAG: hypothetical protein ACI9MR_001886, partial [Myxococcota bacterium]
MKQTGTLLCAVAALLLGPAAMAEGPLMLPSSDQIDGLPEAVSVDQLLFHSSFRSATIGVPASAESPPKRIKLNAVPDKFSVHGDLVVLEGDDRTVSNLGNGRWGLRLDETAQNPVAITTDFLDRFGDNYDFVVVWTAFRDRGAEGLAYYIGIANDTEGIGV